MLLLYYHLVFEMKEKECHAVQFVHDALGISKSIITEARDQFNAFQTVRTRDGSQRGGRNGPMAPPGTTRRLREKVEQINQEGRQVTAKELRKWLGSEPSDDEEGRTPVQVSHKTVCNWLHALGFHRAEGKRGYTLTEERKARVREYLIDFAKAYELDRDEMSPYKIVYMDESYLHVNHKSNFSWFTVDGDHRSANSNGDGQRIIIVHAITDDGPVIANGWREGGTRQGFPKPEGWFASEVGKRGKGLREGSGSGRGRGRGRKRGGRQGARDVRSGEESRPVLGTLGDATNVQGTHPDGNSASVEPVGPSRIVISNEQTAEMLFPAGKKNSEDYHENMDCSVFLTWLEKRLWPTFKSLYKDHKMILILDNAPYHHGMEDGWKSPLKMSKTEGAALLSDLGIGTIEVTRRNEDAGKEDVMTFTVPRKGRAFVNAPKGPTIPEVRQAAFAALKDIRPDDILTRAERWFKQNDAGYMLFTPPYCPDFQPIELFWGDAKNYVASTWKGRTRTMQDAVNWLRRGWYGGEAVDDQERRPPVNCRALVDHSIKKVNEAICRDEILSGSVQGGLNNIPSSYKVSLDSGLEHLETGDEVRLLDVQESDCDEGLR